MKDKKHIPFFNYPKLFLSDEKEISEVMHDVMCRGAFILQQDLRRFEKNMEKFIGVKHVFGVADGTNALMLALRAINIGPDDEVILPSHTYIATAAAVHYVGAKPVLVECGRDHMIDLDSMKLAITDNTKVIMPVQLNGRTSDMDAILALAHEYGLEIIEDAAQAVGAKYKGQSAGTFGSAGTFSFYPAKILGCFGDGGAVVTNDDKVAERIALLRDHGRNEAGEVITWGTNCRLDNLHAAVLDYKLKRLRDDLERRREIARRYHEGMIDLTELLLPPSPDEDTVRYDVYQNYEIEAESRDALKKYLADNGIHCIIQWGGNGVHQFNGLGFEDVSLPYTERMFERSLLLPMNTSLSDGDVNRIVETICAFYRKGGLDCVTPIPQ